jgi:hypothetical protein
LSDFRWRCGKYAVDASIVVTTKIIFFIAIHLKSEESITTTNLFSSTWYSKLNSITGNSFRENKMIKDSQLLLKPFKQNLKKKKTSLNRICILIKNRSAIPDLQKRRISGK